MSERTALYRFYDSAGALLYIGVSENLDRRWKHHATVQPWWPEVVRRSVEWYPDRDAAEEAEVAAIKTEGPRHNVMHSLCPPPRPAPPSYPSEGGRHLSTAEAGRLANTGRCTVDREIARGNLHAEKIGKTWVIEQAEAERWAAQFQPWATQRKRASKDD